jgi:hypothetical protein
MNELFPNPVTSSSRNDKYDLLRVHLTSTGIRKEVQFGVEVWCFFNPLSCQQSARGLQGSVGTLEHWQKICSQYFPTWASSVNCNDDQATVNDRNDALKQALVDMLITSRVRIVSELTKQEFCLFPCPEGIFSDVALGTSRMPEYDHLRVLLTDPGLFIEDFVVPLTEIWCYFHPHDCQTSLRLFSEIPPGTQQHWQHICMKFLAERKIDGNRESGANVMATIKAAAGKCLLAQTNRNQVMVDAYKELQASMGPDDLVKTRVCVG